MPKKIIIKKIEEDGFFIDEVVDILGNFPQFAKIKNKRDWLYRAIRQKKLDVTRTGKLKITDKSFNDLIKGKIDLNHGK
jgi:hypothetical protein